MHWSYSFIWAAFIWAAFFGAAFIGAAVGCSTAALHAEPPRPEAEAEAAPVKRAGVAGVAVPPGPLLLGPGDVAELALGADGSAMVQLATPAGNEQFVLILGSESLELGERSFDYAVTLGGSGSPARAELLNGCSVSSQRFARGPMPSEPVAQGKPPSEGASRALRVPAQSGAVLVQARALSVGEQAVVWSDTTHPSTLDQAFVAQFRQDFEQTILPRARAVFGTEPDTDGDGRIGLVFSALTRDTGVAFFTSCDLLPAQPGCPGGNHGEYLYLTPPDAIAPPYNTPNAIKEILAHEASHLLHFSRKVLKNQLSSWDDGVYMSEGFGALAQDVTGYQAGNLYVTKAGLEGIDLVSFGELLRAQKSLEKPRDGVLRGAAYLFVRYLYDRAGGDSVNGLELINRGGPAFVRALLESPKPISLALPEVMGATSPAIALDFYTALALSNRDEAGGVAPKNPCFGFLPTLKDPVTGKQRGADLFAAFHGQRMSGPKSVAVAAADGKLRQGGVEYLTLDATAQARVAVLTLQVEPRAQPRLRIARRK